jgi:hypothetical protein
MRRPSPAIAISVAALVVALSGTSYAATGGTFLLGRANSATALSSLSNSKGTALQLSSKPGTPPLTVSNSVQVPKLNASELGGSPAAGFMQGTGSADSGNAAITGPGEAEITGSATSSITGVCDADSATGADLEVNLVGGGSIVWWNKDGTSNSGSGFAQVTPESGLDYVVVVQVAQGAAVSTYTASQTYNAGTDTCSFTAQVVITS